MNFFSHLMQDLRLGARQLRGHAALTIVAAGILALGIGSSAAVFSVLDQAILQPLPYPRPRELVYIHNAFPKNQVAVAGVSGFDYAEISRRHDGFASAGILYWNDLTLTGLGSARHIDAVNASATLFEVFGVQPRIGRLFSTADDQHGAPGTALLSDTFWRSAFGADPHVIGQVIHLDGMPYSVIGVMPASFQFPSAETQLWIPTALRADGFSIQGGRTEKWLHMVARLAPGVTQPQAESILQTISNRLSAAFPMFYPGREGWRFTARPMAQEQTDSIRRWLYLAFAAVLSVLLIACINVSALLLVRATARTPEMAIRMALGASRYRVIRQMLAETALLALCGCLLGIVFALAAVRLINVYGPLGQPASVGAATLLFASALTVLCTLLAGVLPALLSAGRSLEGTLRGGATRTMTRGTGWASGVVAIQISLAITLLFTAAGLSRSFLNLTRVPPGFVESHLWSGALNLAPRTYTDDGSWNARFFEPLLASLRSIPGVEGASGGPVPFNPSGIWTEALRLPGRPKMTPPPEAQIGVALPGYFEVMRIPLLHGRTFSDHDRSGSPPVAIISQTLARDYFPGENPIGKEIASGGMKPPARIIGIVGDVQNSDLGEAPAPEIYYPELQQRSESMYIVLRSAGGTDPTAEVRRAIEKLDPNVALYDVRSLEDRVSHSLRLRGFIAVLLNAFAFAGLLLAGVGLYGSLAHLVELRHREIGIRAALGASRSQVARIIVSRGGIVAGCGLAGGLALAILAERLIRSQLFGVGVTDEATWGAVLVAILPAAGIALSIPTWRATRIDPSTALREE